MDREFKFRAWVFSEMDYDCHLDTYSGATIFGLQELDAKIDTTEDSPKIHIMQWTGVKDVNGVDIYEGDVIDCDALSHSHSFKTKIIRCEVVFSGAMFYPKPINGYNFGVSFDGSNVLGNIYENPELLQQ